METAPIYTPADVTRATRTVADLRREARENRAEAVKSSHIFGVLDDVSRGCRADYYPEPFTLNHPTREGIKRAAILVDAIRARQQVLDRMAEALDATAGWIEESAKVGAPPVAAPADDPESAPPVEVATLDTVASKG